MAKLTGIAAAMFAGLLTVTAPQADAQEALKALIGSETEAAPEQEPGRAPPPSAPQPGMVKGTGPDAVVAPIRPAEPVIAAKTLFGAKREPAPLAARAIGFYSRGCLAGGVALPVDGPAWQAMRLSRNRNWGHPDLVELVQKFAVEAKADGWPGLLVGDISQPRGGPMLTGHSSHQIGLDADIWFTPMPDRTLSLSERENMSAVSMLAPGHLEVDRRNFTLRHIQLLRRAASYREVERVLVHPAIKKELCTATKSDSDKAWLSKVRPVWGHYYHFHIRMACPKGMGGCQPQPLPASDDGCGKELDDWYKRLTAPRRPVDPNAPRPKPPPPITMEQLPADCRVVLNAPQPAAVRGQPGKSAGN